MEESTVRCVKGEDCHRLSTRKNLEGDYLFCSVPAVTHYARGHCPVSGGGRSGHPETGWQPSQRSPASPNRGFLGALWSRRYIEEAGWVIWSKTKNMIFHGLEQNRPRSAAHHDEGGLSARALCIPQWTYFHSSLKWHAVRNAPIC